MHHMTSTVAWSLLMVAAVVSQGCSRGGDPKMLIRDANNSNGRRLMNLYAQHQAEYQYGPKNESSFKRYIATKNPIALEEMGIPLDTLDTVFISERDGQPFFIRYGAPFAAGGRQAIVTEREGVEGKAVVFFHGPREVVVPAADLKAYQAGEKDELPEKPVATPPQGGKG